MQKFLKTYLQNVTLRRCQINKNRFQIKLVTVDSMHAKYHAIQQNSKIMNQIFKLTFLEISSKRPDSDP